MFFFDETDHGYMCMWQGGRAHIYHTYDAWIICEDDTYWFVCSHYQGYTGPDYDAVTGRIGYQG